MRQSIRGRLSVSKLKFWALLLALILAFGCFVTLCRNRCEEKGFSGFEDACSSTSSETIPISESEFFREIGR